MATSKNTTLAQTKKAVADAEANHRRNELATRAYQLKTEGMSWWDIAEELGITEQSAHMLVSERITLAAELVDIGAKRSILTMELERLDKLQRAVWANAMSGDVRSVEAVLKVIDKRAKLLGLEEVTSSSVTANTIVVPGNPLEYVAALRAVQTTMVEAS